MALKRELHQAEVFVGFVSISVVGYDHFGNHFAEGPRNGFTSEMRSS